VLVLAEVLGEVVDPLGQDRDLDLGLPESLSSRRNSPISSVFFSAVIAMGVLSNGPVSRVTYPAGGSRRCVI